MRVSSTEIVITRYYRQELYRYYRSSVLSTTAARARGDRGDGEDGLSGVRRSVACYQAHSTRYATGIYARAAPLPKCHRSDADNGDQRRPAAS